MQDLLFKVDIRVRVGEGAEVKESTMAGYLYEMLVEDDEPDRGSFNVTNLQVLSKRVV